MSLIGDLRRVLSAAQSEPGRADRELNRQIGEDLDELASRRRVRDETDAFPSRAAFDESAGADRFERDLRGD